MNVPSLRGCGEGTDIIRRLGSIHFGDLPVGCDSNVKQSRREESRMNIGEKSSVTLLLSSETTMALKRQTVFNHCNDQNRIGVTCRAWQDFEMASRSIPRVRSQRA